MVSNSQYLLSTNNVVENVVNAEKIETFIIRKTKNSNYIFLASRTKNT